MYLDSRTNLLCNFCADDIGVKYAPEIMKWSANVYHDAFSPHLSAAPHASEPVSLQAQDYMIGDRKFGGNAQCVTRNRFVHHTSLLYDYDERNMDFLRMPPKVPEHRRGRDHKDFICALRTYFARPEDVMDSMVDNFRRTNFLEKCVDVSPDEVMSADEQEFWCRTKELSSPE